MVFSYYTKLLKRNDKKVGNEQIIEAWKNPQKRKGIYNHPAGKGFQEMSIEEMMGIHGAAEVSPMTTPGISAAVKVSVEVSKNSTKFCVGLTASAISGISIANTKK